MQNSQTQTLLSAECNGERVTIGFDSLLELKRLSDLRLLSCPVCGSPVTLHAGSVRAHHFSHLPGSVCFTPNSEPETPEHRNGKLALGNWLRIKVPNAKVTVEAWFPETKQRADILLETAEPGKEKVAIEFQCANLTAREWRRRRSLYRESGILDLWILGGSRFKSERKSSAPDAEDDSQGKSQFFLRTTELERTLILAGAPLLFLLQSDAYPTVSPHSLKICRFRQEDISDLVRPIGTLASKALMSLDFPWNLLSADTYEQDMSSAGLTSTVRSPQLDTDKKTETNGSEFALLEWLKIRYRVQETDLPEVFGIAVLGQDAFACAGRLWQASLYYRFIEGSVGEKWSLEAVEIWARLQLPLAQPVRLKRLQKALQGVQEIFSAAGFLQLPKGGGGNFGRVIASLQTLQSPPDRKEIEKLVRFRRIRSKD